MMAIAVLPVFTNRNVTRGLSLEWHPMLEPLELPVSCASELEPTEEGKGSWGLPVQIDSKRRVILVGRGEGSLQRLGEWNGCVGFRLSKKISPDA